MQIYRRFCQGTESVVDIAKKLLLIQLAPTLPGAGALQADLHDPNGDFEQNGIDHNTDTETSEIAATVLPSSSSSSGKQRAMPLMASTSKSSDKSASELGFMFAIEEEETMLGNPQTDEDISELDQVKMMELAMETNDLLSASLTLDNHDNQPPSGSSSHPRSTDKGKTPSLPNEIDTDRDLALAMQMQLEWEFLEWEQEELARFAQVLFTCGICLEEQSEDFVSYVDDCDHAFCRTCMKDYIISKLKDHHFPILCPTCVAETRKHPGAVSQMLVEQVGIPDQDYVTFEEFQLAPYSVFVHCRKCEQSVFVDKNDFQAQQLLVCPLPACDHIWCRDCQQTVLEGAGGPQHSCDGSAELTHLMKEQGWKRCPGCRTPIQKTSGCDHMTCISPGCNKHFCYMCGGEMNGSHTCTG